MVDWADWTGVFIVSFKNGFIHRPRVSILSRMFVYATAGCTPTTVTPLPGKTHHAAGSSPPTKKVRTTLLCTSVFSGITQNVIKGFWLDFLDSLRLAAWTKKRVVRFWRRCRFFHAVESPRRRRCELLATMGTAPVASGQHSQLKHLNTGIQQRYRPNELQRTIRRLITHRLRLDRNILAVTTAVLWVITFVENYLLLIYFFYVIYVNLSIVI